jgi:hypothetical protein
LATRDGACGQPLWYYPHFKSRPSTAIYQPAWEHLSGKTLTLDNTVLDSAPYTNSQLESYLTEDNGVEWHRDHQTITIEFAGKTKEKYDTTKLYKA